MGKKVFVDLSHPFYGDMPLWPYFAKPEIAPMHSMAKGGVLTTDIISQLRSLEQSEQQNLTLYIRQEEK